LLKTVLDCVISITSVVGIDKMGEFV